jgi:hypothetical protein
MAVVVVARYMDMKASVTYIRVRYQRGLGFECGRDAQSWPSMGLRVFVLQLALYNVPNDFGGRRLCDGHVRPFELSTICS